jgi:hypothetical protein
VKKVSAVETEAGRRQQAVRNTGIGVTRKITAGRKAATKPTEPCPPDCKLRDADDEIMAIVDIVRERVTKDLSDKIGEFTRYFEKQFGDFSAAERMEIVNAFAVSYIEDGGENVMEFPAINAVNRLVITKKHHAARIARTLIK